jgi:hypothetical protein
LPDWVFSMVKPAFSGMHHIDFAVRSLSSARWTQTSKGKSTISTGPFSIAFCMFTRPGNIKLWSNQPNPDPESSVSPDFCFWNSSIYGAAVPVDIQPIICSHSLHSYSGPLQNLWRLSAWRSTWNIITPFGLHMPMIYQYMLWLYINIDYWMNFAFYPHEKLIVAMVFHHCTLRL